MASSVIDPVLASRLSEELPDGLRFTTHHLSSPPTKSAPLLAPPPNQKSEETYCESQFLSISVTQNGLKLQAFAIEVLIYTTRDLTTLFVSKADSTGYLNLLPITQRTPSPIRTVLTTFLLYLVETRQRPGVRLVVSLFARAQDQYLFPGSIENEEKHVLDDRGLIKWWCKVLDGVIQRWPAGQPDTADGLVIKPQGYLRVPGCDLPETRTFFPRDPAGFRFHPRWKPEDPLRIIRKATGVPERCLIPRFPDDPKARFVIELDDELPENQWYSQTTPTKILPPGKWMSVKSLDQFWELMAYRQECSAGRLVGFLWAVFTPPGFVELQKSIPVKGNKALSNDPFSRAQSHSGENSISSYQASERSPSPEPPLSPYSKMIARATGPTTLPHPDESTDPQTPSKKRTTRGVAEFQENVSPSKRQKREQREPYYWPLACRGEVVTLEPIYKRINDLLMELDYAGAEAAATSTQQWIEAAATAVGVKKWGYEIHGTKEMDPVVPTPTSSYVTAGPAMIDTSLIRKAKRSGAETNHQVEHGVNLPENGDVQLLNQGLIRKKPKVAPG